MKLTPEQIIQFDRDGYPVKLPWKDGLPGSALQTSPVPLDEQKAAA